MKKLWYYASLNQIQKIVSKGIIKPPKRGNLNDEFPCIWLSSNPEWDTPPDVIYIDKRKFHGMPVEPFKCARIEVLQDSDIKDWETYKVIANIPQLVSKNIEQLAIDDGLLPKDWFFSLKRIPASQWVITEYAGGVKWEEYL